MDSLRKGVSAKYAWTHAAALLALCRRSLFRGSPLRGLPGKLPSGIETKVVDSLILLHVLGTKDSVGKFFNTVTGLTWTADQVKDNFRRWLGTGFIRQGQYDTLYPFDDRTPTPSPHHLCQCGRYHGHRTGTDGVKVMGTFTI